MKIINVTPGLLPIPPNGWGAVEKKIELLNSNNAQCYFYKANLYGPTLIWPAIAVLDVDVLYNSDIMRESNWHNDTQRWIEYWGSTPFEHSLQHCITTTYTQEKIISEQIEYDVKSVWGTDDFQNLSRSYMLQTTATNIEAHIYPHKDRFGNFDLHLVIFNTNNPAKIDDIIVYCDDAVIFNMKECSLSTNQWYNCVLNTTANFKKIKMTYNTSFSGNVVPHSEEFEFNDIESIYKYVLRWEYFDNH
jgi:hypothetical protein